MKILGVNLFHGDSAACLLVDGKLIAAVEEERFTKIKHYSGFPLNSIKYCLQSKNYHLEDIDYICVNYNRSYNLIPKFCFIFSYFSKKNFFKNLLKYVFYNNFFLKDNLVSLFKKYFNHNINSKTVYVPHHLSHAFSTLFFNEYNENSIVFSFDGSGDFSTLESYLINQENFKLLEKNTFPHSLGFFYTAFTQFLGFKNYGDEYKFMGLAGYGEPTYEYKIKKLIKSSYPFRLNLKYFNIPEIDYSNNKPEVSRIYNQNFINLFEKDINENKDIDFNKKKNIAASAQKVFEDIVINYLNNYKNKFDTKKIYLTGGCALNSSLVGKIIRKNIFEEVKVNTNPSDAGGAVGAAFFQSRKLGEKLYDSQEISYLGNSYDNKYIEKNIIEKIKNDKRFDVFFFNNNSNLNDEVTTLIKKNHLIFWFQGKMEWGPRALGNRSILADPSKKNIKDIINITIKKREEFRPLAPVVLEEDANKYFEMYNNKSEYMNKVFFAKRNTIEKFPGAVHIDKTSRVQTINSNDNVKLYNLLYLFKQKYGSSILINTSLNIDSPIVRSPEDAFKIFQECNIRDMILNDWIISKKNKKV